MSEYIMRESGYPGRLETEIVGELIRCKGCKHFAGEGMYCACDIMVHYDHFYCYHAERKEGEADGL